MAMFVIMSIAVVSIPMESLKSGDVFNVLYTAFVNLFKFESTSILAHFDQKLRGGTKSFDNCHNLNLIPLQVEC